MENGNIGEIDPQLDMGNECDAQKVLMRSDFSLNGGFISPRCFSTQY